MRHCRYFKKQKSRCKHRLVLWLLVVSAVLWAVLAYFDNVVNPTISTIAHAKVSRQVSHATGTALTGVLGEGIAYSDLIQTSGGANGDILTVRANSPAINQLLRRAAASTQSNLDSQVDRTIELPIGTLSGIPLLTGLGPTINLRIITIAQVSSYLTSDLIDAGINQTNHRIFLSVSVNTTLIISGRNRELNSRTELLVAENIYIGRVPQVYLNFGEQLDLVP